MNKQYVKGVQNGKKGLLNYVRQQKGNIHVEFSFQW